MLDRWVWLSACVRVCVCMCVRARRLVSRSAPESNNKWIVLGGQEQREDWREAGATWESGWGVGLEYKAEGWVRQQGRRAHPFGRGCMRRK